MYVFARFFCLNLNLHGRFTPADASLIYLLWGSDCKRCGDLACWLPRDRGQTLECGTNVLAVWWPLRGQPQAHVLWRTMEGSAGTPPAWPGSWELWHEDTGRLSRKPMHLWQGDFRVSAEHHTGC